MLFRSRLFSSLFKSSLLLQNKYSSFNTFNNVFNSLHKSDYFVHYEFIVYNRNGSNLCTSNPADLMDCEFVKFIKSNSTMLYLLFSILFVYLFFIFCDEFLISIII